MEKKKRYSLDAKELLTKSELYEIKAGENLKGNSEGDININICHSNCIACTSCVSCTTKMMDVIVLF